MTEYRYQAVTLNGKPVQGIIYASNTFDAKKKTAKLADQQGLQIENIRKRKYYFYKVRKRNSKNVLKGEIPAFTLEEVRTSLERMDYEVLSVQRNFLHFRAPVPEKDVVTFIRLCADLLKEKFTFDEILTIVASDIEHRTLRETVMEIHKDLRMGNEGRGVFLKHSDVFGKFTAYMLAVAANSGNMAEIYDNTAKFIERSAEFKKNLRSVMFMPIIVMLASIAALVFYVAYIFPEIAGMLLKYNIEVPPITAATLEWSDFFKNNIIELSFGALIPVIGVTAFLKSDFGRILWAKTTIRLPIIGELFFRSSMEVFARVFHALYSGSGENIEAIKNAAEACRNAYIEQEIKELIIPAMLRDGRSFADALALSKAFPKSTISALKSGEETGTLAESILRLANFYEKDTTYRLSRIVDAVNLLVSIFVSLLIVGLTLLSTEIGFVKPPTTYTR